MAADPKTPAQDKSARLAQALRANLARRKAQGRARKEEADRPATGNGATTGVTPEMPSPERDEKA
ncbi:hypothetical protein [Roseixanthobacter glucoisosaccharinicivorans]|uniref:hypothetical protein n=1 Tax=Roseixanthobacter glucoisosaccharinicivorans TaxID=3119923 RepID=UPI00372A5F5C